MTRIRAVAAVALFAAAALLTPAASHAVERGTGPSAPQYHWQWGG